MHSFQVPVRNEHTGEIRVVEILSGHVADAQIEALERLFHQEGWRKAVALRPEWQMQEGDAAI